jgi:hypothetical protein
MANKNYYNEASETAGTQWTGVFVNLTTGLDYMENPKSTGSRTPISRSSNLQLVGIKTTLPSNFIYVQFCSEVFGNTDLCCLLPHIPNPQLSLWGDNHPLHSSRPIKQRI